MKMRTQCLKGFHFLFFSFIQALMVDLGTDRFIRQVCASTSFCEAFTASFSPQIPLSPQHCCLPLLQCTVTGCIQMDDEASLLPRKLQSALEQALEQRNDIINLDSDSDSDEGD